jgi:hypothetical protein
MLLVGCDAMLPEEGANLPAGLLPAERAVF